MRHFLKMTVVFLVTIVMANVLAECVSAETVCILIVAKVTYVSDRHNYLKNAVKVGDEIKGLSIVNKNI